jgi:hypothetical protein
MSNINKKQMSLAVLAVVFATAMVASLLVADSAYARQSISQRNDQYQDSSIVTAGAGSTVATSGNNAATATNTNNGGNARAG